MQFDSNLAVYVYASNMSGIPVTPYAKHAREFKSHKLGTVQGMSGGAYALPILGTAPDHKPLPWKDLQSNVWEFLNHAEHWYGRGAQFQITDLARDLKYKEDFIQLFRSAPDNCWFDIEWMPTLGQKFRYWGTHPKTLAA